MLRPSAKPWILWAWALVLPARVAGAAPADDQYAVAAAHYQAQRWDLAVAEFREFLARHFEDRRDDDARFYLGEALLQRKQYAEAFDAYAQLLENTPQGKRVRQARFRVGESAYLAGRLDDAQKYLAEYRRNYPTSKLNAYVLAYLGDIALGEDDLVQAGEWFTAGLKEYGHSPLHDQYCLGLGRVAEQSGRGDEATEQYRAVADNKESPLAAKARFLLGTLQYNQSQYAEAEQTLRPLQAERSSDELAAKARLNHAWALYKLGRHADAQTGFRQLTGDRQVGRAALYGLGVAQKAAGDFDSSEKTLLAAARLNRDDPLAPAMLCQAGDALLAAGRVDAAEAVFAQVLTEYSTSEWSDDAAAGRIRAALDRSRHADVERQCAEFQRQFGSSPLHDDVQRLLARSLVEGKEYGRAVDVLEPLTGRAEISSHGAPEADRYLLAVAYRGLGRHDDAARLLADAASGANNSMQADALVQQAAALRASDKVPQAIELLEKYLADDPSGPQADAARGELALAYVSQQRLVDARRLHERLVADQAKSELLNPVTLHVADAALADGEDELAAELFTRLVDDEIPKVYRQKALSGLGWAHYHAGRWEQSAETLRALLESDPPAPLAAEAALLRGRALERTNAADAALAMYARVIEQSPSAPERPQAMLAAARLHERLDQSQEASAMYERLLAETDATDAVGGELADSIRYEWSWVLRKTGDDARADELLSELNSAESHGAYWADATFRLAEQAHQRGELDRANQLVAAVLAEKPREELLQHALYLQTQIAAQQDDWKQVAESAGRLVRKYPRGPLRLPAEYWSAEAAYRQGDFESAGRLFAELSGRAEGRQEGWLAMVPLRRAQVLAQDKHWTDAEKLAESIAGRWPQFTQQYEADYLIGRCRSAQARFGEAREAYSRVVSSETGAKTETAAMAQWMIGETHFHQKNYDLARREYLKVEILYKYPRWQAAALLQAGKCSEQLGDTAEAVRLYERLVERYPNAEFTAEAKQRLGALQAHMGRKPAR